jgi:hypothetical protein
MTALDPQFISYGLDPLTSGQIDEYLQHVAAELETISTTPEEVRAFLDGIYDLSDLITRPIILDMAVVSILERQINPGNKTLANGPAGLYEAYTRVKLDVDWRKAASRRELLSYDERMRFAEECALEMFKGDVLTIAEHELLRLARRVVPNTRDASFDELLTDLRTCSFLTVDGEGGLQFIHRSYQEFFLARLLRRELQEQSTKRLATRLRWEYTYFLGAFAFTDNDFYNLLFELSRSSAAATETAGSDSAVVAGDNAAQALLAARESIAAISWKGRTLSKAKRPHIAILRSNLASVVIEECSTEHLEFVETALSVELTGAGIDRLTATRCTGSIDLRGSVGAISLSGGELTITDRSTARALAADSMRLDLTATKAGPCAIELRSVAGSVTLQTADVTVDNSRLRIDATEGIVQGRIDSSVVEVELSSFDNLATRQTASVIVVRGKREVIRDVDDTVRQPNRVLASEAAAGQGSIIVVSPFVPLDAWWTHQTDLLNFGGSLVDSQPSWTGFAVRRKYLPARDGGTTFVQVRRQSGSALVIEGRGDALRHAMKDVQSIVVSATAHNLAEPGWFTGRLRSLLEALPGTEDLVDELIDVTEARLDALHTTGIHLT